MNEYKVTYKDPKSDRVNYYLIVSDDEAYVQKRANEYRNRVIIAYSVPPVRTTYAWDIVNIEVVS